MKPDFNKKYNTIAAYVLVVAAILISYILIIIYWPQVHGTIRSLLATLSPFFYGFAIAYILNPIYGFCMNGFEKIFQKGKKSPKKPEKAVKICSLIATYIIVLAFLTLFLSIIAPQLWQSFQKLMLSFPSYINAVEEMLDIRLEDTPLFSSEVLRNFLDNTENGLVDWLERVYSALTAYAPRLFNAISGIATQVWNFLLGFIISIYMLAGKHTFARQSKRLLFAMFKRERAETVIEGVRKTHSTFGGFLSGKIIDSLIVGVICFFGMSLLSIPYAPLVSVVVGVTNVIPYFGPFLGAIPSIFIILLDNPIKALWFSIFILILQQLDGNLIGPKIIGQKIGLSSFWVVFALLIMGSLMGVLGLLLAVPIFALIYDFVKYLCAHALHKKGYTAETVEALCAERSPTAGPETADDAENTTDTDKGEKES